MADTAIAPPPAAAPAAPAPPTLHGGTSEGFTDLRQDPAFQAEFDTPDDNKAPDFSQLDNPLPVAEPPAPEPPAAPEVPAVEEPAPVEEPTEPADKVVAQPEGETEPIPEDVRVQTTREGAKQYVMPESRFNEYQNAFKSVRDVETLIGEPLTQDVIQEMQNARVDLHGIEASLKSPSVDAQQKILDYLAQISDNAFTNGETPYNSLATFAAVMPDFLAQRNPAAYQIQANAYMRRVIDNVYQSTAGRDDDLSKSQFASAQHLDQMIFGKFSDPKQIQRPDPIAVQRAQLEQQQNAFNRQQQQQAETRWRDQLTNHDQTTKSDLGKVVTDVLKPVATAYKDFPKALDGIKTQLLQIVNDAVAKDRNFQQIRSNLLEEARIATREETRSARLDELKQRYVAKAKMVLDPGRNREVREILNQNAARVKQQADAKVQRAQQAAGQRQPSAGGATPQRGILPAPNGSSGGLKSADDVRREILNF